MAKLSLFLALSAVLVSLPASLAGPACAQKYYQQANCISECRNRWGWGHKLMGADRWGNVMNDVADPAAIIASACGSTAAATPTVPVTGFSRPPLGQAPSYSMTTSAASSTAAPTTTTSTRATTTTTPATTSSTSTSTSETLSVTDLPAVQNLAAPNSSQRFTTSFVPPPPPPTTTAQPTTVAPPPPAPTIAAAPSPANNGGGSGGSTSSSDIQAYLTAHNSVRSQHGASPLTWNNNLASKAQEWANRCVTQHSGGSLGPFGENLAWGFGSGYGIASAVKSWTDEVSLYRAGNTNGALHFTQVVWKATTEVGCAVANCPGLFPSSPNAVAQYFVCEYSVQGNVIGQFPQNVQA